MAKTPSPAAAVHDDGESRRDFLYVATGAVGAVGVLASVWPLVDQMNPSADVLALGSIEIDLGRVPEGQAIKVLWRGKPVYVRHRTADEIASAQETDGGGLPHPETDEERVQKPEWLIVLGVCTHLGCVPLAYSGEFGGFFCPCHGSHYDTSGRIRIGPAPLNLEIPPYEFLDDSTIRVG